MPLSVNIGQSSFLVLVGNGRNFLQNWSELGAELVGNGRKWSEFGGSHLRGGLYIGLRGKRVPSKSAQKHYEGAWWQKQKSRYQVGKAGLELSNLMTLIRLSDERIGNKKNLSVHLLP